MAKNKIIEGILLGSFFLGLSNLSSLHCLVAQTKVTRSLNNSSDFYTCRDLDGFVLAESIPASAAEALYDEYIRMHKFFTGINTIPNSHEITANLDPKVDTNSTDPIICTSMSGEVYEFKSYECTQNNGLKYVTPLTESEVKNTILLQGQMKKDFESYDIEIRCINRRTGEPYQSPSSTNSSSQPTKNKSDRGVMCKQDFMQFAESNCNYIGYYFGFHMTVCNPEADKDNEPAAKPSEHEKHDKIESEDSHKSDLQKHLEQEVKEAREKAEVAKEESESIQEDAENARLKADQLAKEAREDPFASESANFWQKEAVEKEKEAKEAAAEAARLEAEAQKKEEALAKVKGEDPSTSKEESKDPEPQNSHEPEDTHFSNDTTNNESKNNGVSVWDDLMTAQEPAIPMKSNIAAETKMSNYVFLVEDDPFLLTDTDVSMIPPNINHSSVNHPINEDQRSMMQLEEETAKKTKKRLESDVTYEPDQNPATEVEVILCNYL